MDPTPDEERLLSFEADDDSPGVTVVDRVERARFAFETSRPVSPHEVSPDEFEFPVTRGVAIETGRLAFSYAGVMVRNHAGMMVSEVSSEETESFPEDKYTIELGSPIKIYLVVESAFSVEMTEDLEATIEFDDTTEVLIGARSYHKQPAATIQTPGDPESLMRAISYFGSALKTSSPERSFPTLRGHPPLIELAEEFHAPRVLERPDTDVHVEVPRDLASVFVVAPLAYYLRADVRPGEVPRIVTDHGFEHRLDGTARSFEREVERVLKQTFLLDCVTRTEGLYPVNLHERNEIEADVDLDFADLYDRTIGGRLDAYLDVPYDVVEPHVPRWKSSAHVIVDPGEAEMLPFLVNDLAYVRTATPTPAEPSEAASWGLDEFMQSEFTRRPDGGSNTGVVTTGQRTSGGALPDISPLVQVEATDALEQTWVGEGVPFGASKALIEAYRNQLGRQPVEEDIDVTLVCNDEEMAEEIDLVTGIYRESEAFPFEVDFQRNLTKEEFEDLLARETHFLHYIGHIDDRGFECADGMYDATTLEETGVEAFFLNACTSYEQGRALIEAGSMAGVVTFYEVIDSGAQRVGETLAKLLNDGFPIRSALNVARTRSIMGGYYLVIGDGNFVLANANESSGQPVIRRIQKLGDDEFTVDLINFPTQEWGVGSITTPMIEGVDEFFLSSGQEGPFELNRVELIGFLEKENTPIIWRNKITWTDQLKFSDI